MSSAELARRSSFEGHSMREKREREKGGLTREREAYGLCFLTCVRMRFVCVRAGGCLCPRGVACVPSCRLFAAIQSPSHGPDTLCL